MNIKNAYVRIVERDGLRPDPEQLRIVAALGDLQVALATRHHGLQKVLSVFKPGCKTNSVRGFYLWGGVGRGKTFLMDLFFETLSLKSKKRIHFHRMMREVHDKLKCNSDTQDPLDKVAADIARDTHVLCFDEFFVHDIADAMILARLLEGLFARGVVLITTSNIPPDGLYADGLQRERFLPAISLLEQHTQVIELDGGIDYRFRVMQKAGTYLTPADDAATARLQKLFLDVAPGAWIEMRSLDILGREIHTLRCAKGVAWFDFNELCDGPRSQNDYIEIARWYQTVIVSEVPVLTHDLENQARRFISMVDEFYDRRVKLILSAAATVGALYQGSKLDIEFRRTASRLNEMQSAEYLHEAHIA